jgi:hypothetical protein
MLFPPISPLFPARSGSSVGKRFLSMPKVVDGRPGGLIELL